MKKFKIKTEKIGKFLREIAVIVIGIAITLSASHWISNRNAEKDLTLYLNAIKVELEENRRIIEEIKENSIRTAINYSEYLRSHDKQSLHLDTLLFYREKTAFNGYTITVNTNAFDMFKASGNMRMIKDKKQILSLWEVYSKLDELKRAIEISQQMKLEEMKKYFYLNSLPDEELLKDPPMYSFYVDMYVPYMQENMCNHTLKFLEETISMFEGAKK